MAPESLIAQPFKELLRSRPTLMSNLYSGGLARAARGRLIDQLGPIREEAPPFPLAAAGLMPLWRAAQERGDYEFLLPLSGQAAAIAARKPARELTQNLAANALAILGSRIDA